MTTVQVRKMIITKFGSIKRFTVAAEMDYRKLVKFLDAAEKVENSRVEFDQTMQQQKGILRRIAIAVNRADEDFDAKYLLTDEKRNAIKSSIREFYGSVPKFCQYHPEFNQWSVYQIIKGHRKTINPTVRSLMETLSLEIY